MVIPNILDLLDHGGLPHVIVRGGARVYGVGACVYGVGACVYGYPMILAQVPWFWV